MAASGFDLGRFETDEIPWRQIARVAPVVILLLLAVYLSFKSVYTVAPYEEAVVLRFGRYFSTSEPGLHFCIPVVDKVLKVNMAEHSLNLPVGIRGSRSVGRLSSEEETLVLTGGLNAASVEWTVQWKVADPSGYLFSFYDRNNEDYVQDVIAMASRTVMNRLIGDYSINEILTEKRGEISEKAREATEKILNKYDCGVSIQALQMQRVTPPDRVKPSFDAVNSSIQERKRLENEANKEKARILPAAYAGKDKLIRGAEGYADRRRAEASGEIAALLAKYRAYQKAPEVTRQRLYLEAMQEILSEVGDKVIIDGDLSSVLPLLQLNQGVQDK